jgi:hypothetical protein
MPVRPKPASPARTSAEPEEAAEPEPRGEGAALLNAGPVALPFARRDIERLRLVLLAQRRLREVNGPASVRRLKAAKSYFEEAVRWLEIHGGPEGRELAARWWGPEPVEGGPAGSPEAAPEDASPASPPPARRRRRRRRRRSSPPANPA